MGTSQNDQASTGGRRDILQRHRTNDLKNDLEHMYPSSYQHNVMESNMMLLSVHSQISIIELG